MEEADAIRFIDAGGDLKDEILRILGVGGFAIVTKFSYWKIVDEHNVREIRIVRGRTTLSTTMSVKYDPRSHSKLFNYRDYLTNSLLYCCNG